MQHKQLRINSIELNITRSHLSMEVTVLYTIIEKYDGNEGQLMLGYNRAVFQSEYLINHITVQVWFPLSDHSEATQLKQ